MITAEPGLAALIDPISGQISRQPVFAPDGVVYDLEALEGWNEQAAGESPMTGEAMPGERTPAPLLRDAVPLIQVRYGFSGCARVVCACPRVTYLHVRARREREWSRSVVHLSD